MSLFLIILVLFLFRRCSLPLFHQLYLISPLWELVKLKARRRTAQLVSSLPFPSYWRLIKHSYGSTELHFGLQPQPCPAANLPQTLQVGTNTSLAIMPANVSGRLSWELQDVVDVGAESLNHTSDLGFEEPPPAAGETSLWCREFEAKLRTRSTCSQEMNPKSKRSILLLCLRESFALSDGTRS